ncbi:MAG: diacylglycerol kinase family protein [bacterium]
MYFFIYENIGNKRKFRKEADRIQLQLANFGIADEHTESTPLRPINEIVKDALKRNMSNIIMVGSDKAAHITINEMAKSKTPSCFGFIPMDTDSNIAKVLGMSHGHKACQDIAKRKIKDVDLGKVGQEYFLTTLRLNAGEEETEIRGMFNRKAMPLPKSCTIKVPFKKQAIMTIPLREAMVVNISPYHKAGELKIASEQSAKINPTDGRLDFFFLPSGENDPDVFKEFRQGSFTSTNISYFNRETLNINTNDKVQLVADGTKIKQFPINIETVTGALRVIVGSNRMF